MANTPLHSTPLSLCLLTDSVLYFFIKPWSPGVKPESLTAPHEGNTWLLSSAEKASLFALSESFCMFSHAECFLLQLGVPGHWTRSGLRGEEGWGCCEALWLHGPHVDGGEVGTLPLCLRDCAGGIDLWTPQGVSSAFGFIASGLVGRVRSSTGLQLLLGDLDLQACLASSGGILVVTEVGSGCH